MASFWPIGTAQTASVLFPIQSEKSPDSGIFTCDTTKKCIMPSSRERHKGIIGRGHDLRLNAPSRPGHSGAFAGNFPLFDKRKGPGTLTSLARHPRTAGEWTGVFSTEVDWVKNR